MSEFTIAPSLPDLVGRHREAIFAIAARCGAERVRVFGSSVHRGESPNDIDFLVRLQPGRSLLDHVALQQELEELLQFPVDVAVEEGLSPYLRDSILAEAIPL